MRCIEDWCKEQAAKNQSLCAEHAKLTQKLKPCRTCGGPLVNGGECRSCYRKSREREATRDAALVRGARLSATQIGTQLGLKGFGVNEVMVELGWLNADRSLTALGTRMGGTVKNSKHGEFVLWPAAIVENKFFMGAVKRLTEGERGPALLKNLRTSDDEGKATATLLAPDTNLRPGITPGDYVAEDGHYVRSKAELAIDNWLYKRGLLHAYERLIPGQDELKCDFFLPGGNVFIEFWGLTGEPYATRKKRKQAFYAEHRLRLIELAPADVKTLDETLAAALRRFGVQLRST
jgi:hypothetical protein